MASPFHNLPPECRACLIDAIGPGGRPYIPKRHERPARSYFDDYMELRTNGLTRREAFRQLMTRYGVTARTLYRHIPRDETSGLAERLEKARA